MIFDKFWGNNSEIIDQGYQLKMKKRVRMANRWKEERTDITNDFV